MRIHTIFQLDPDDQPDDHTELYNSEGDELDTAELLLQDRDIQSNKELLVKAVEQILLCKTYSTSWEALQEFVNRDLHGIIPILSL